MDDKLLVRIYDVGLGDCIYVRVPDRDHCRHILIDCGNKYSSPDLLEAAVADLETQLPVEPTSGKRRLDLLVATHAHEDHVRGFDAEPFKNIRIERIWMSVAMKPDHEKAAKARELHAVALRALSDLRRAAPSSGLMALADSLYALSKSDALDALVTELPQANHIQPVYVHAGTPANVTGFFDDPAIRLRILAPMEDIDGYYLGQAAEAGKRLALVERSAAERETAPAGGGPVEPLNISAEDFARLKARLLNNALALALIDGHVVNNTSVVLLLEWRGRRLLFTGDAEVNLAREGGFKEGASNGSWNVMWETHREDLHQPLDFLKVGHHGSNNATPWTAQTIAPKERGGSRKPHPVNAILDAILPSPGDGGSTAATAAVSTHRTKSWKGIPDPLLMAELGKRVGNVKLYDEAVFYAKEGRLDTKPYQVAPTTPQPQRTDLEGGHHIDFLFPAKGRRPPGRRTKAVRGSP